jgi:hypothetical protein
MSCMPQLVAWMIGTRRWGVGALSAASENQVVVQSMSAPTVTVRFQLIPCACVSAACVRKLHVKGCSLQARSRAARTYARPTKSPPGSAQLTAKQCCSASSILPPAGGA